MNNSSIFICRFVTSENFGKPEPTPPVPELQPGEVRSFVINATFLMTICEEPAIHHYVAGEEFMSVHRCEEHSYDNYPPHTYSYNNQPDISPYQEISEEEAIVREVMLS
jgi:hypothetical protein